MNHERSPMNRERSEPGSSEQRRRGAKRPPSLSSPRGQKGPEGRYGSASLSVKILWSLVALAMIVLGAIWTIAGSGVATTLGPIVAGLGVALGYVVLVQKRD